MTPAFRTEFLEWGSLVMPVALTNLARTGAMLTDTIFLGHYTGGAGSLGGHGDDDDADGTGTKYLVPCGCLVQP